MRCSSEVRSRSLQAKAEALPMRKSDWGALVLAVGISGCQTPSALPSAPPLQTRIISLTPSLTEVLFALEAGPQVVGVTANDHFPPEVEKLPEVGDFHLDSEALLALHPDLVIFDPALHRQHLQQLKSLGLKLKPLPTQNLNDLEQSVLQLGQELGRQQRARELVASMRQRLQDCRERAARLKHRPTALIEIWSEPLVTAGKGSYVSEIVEATGFVNICTQPDYPQLDLEEVHRLNPEVLILTHPIRARLEKAPGWSTLDAVKRGRVVVVPEDWLVRPGPRVMQALDHLQAWLLEHSD